MESKWTIRWITDWDEIWSSAFQERWKRLFAESVLSNVFFHPLHVRAWIDYYGGVDRFEPCFLMAGTDEGSEAFVPFLAPKA